MTQPFRIPQGGQVDRAQVLGFTYDGIAFEGHAGDTLASALLANGVHLVARSFKYHRPRGIFSAGAEEPNALVQVGTGARTEPNVRATMLELHEGLEAASQNCWPSVGFDVGAINDRLSGLMPAGFYYKTFMWPPTPRWWLRYEHVIRKAAGMGRSATVPDPDRYEHQHAHCDVLVVGGGIAGLEAARVAAKAGARVIVCDEGSAWGGRVADVGAMLADRPVEAWMADTVRDLAGAGDVTLLLRTTAFGYYDDSLIGAVERLAAQGSRAQAGPRERLWKIRAKKVVLASGAIERGIAYAGNDLPGSMLAGAARAYVRRYGVRPGSRAVIFTNNDSAYAAALDLYAAGVEIAAVVDARPETALDRVLPRQARAAGLVIIPGAAISRAQGSLRVTSVDVAPLSGGPSRRLDCDLACVSGGWNPAVHLFSQARGSLRYDEAIAAFVPEVSPHPIVPVGAASGRFEPDAALTPLWVVPAAPRAGKRFVDLQNDVTVEDIALAAREGYQSIEHLKRYTTLGMGTDQGKTSNILGLALMAQALDVPIPRVGTTTFRAPYTPVTLGAFRGAHEAAHVEPVRLSAMHAWHREQGASFVNTGLWKRPHSYPRPGETPDDAAWREALNVRTHVGLVDVSTLGKIELQGPDVALFLDRVYINRWDSLAVGRCRYGVMLREDGLVLDDGTTSRLADRHYLMTTTTVNAVRVMQHLEFLLQTQWRDLRVRVCSVTEQWAAAALSGPKARAVLARVVDCDVSNEAFPFLTVTTCGLRTAQGVVPARLFRMSYSGELAFEVHVPADRGAAMWEALIAAGEGEGLMAYGTEAMATLRIEKGHVVIGPEADGRTTADDLGLGKLVSSAKWCIGKPLLSRPALTAPGRWQLVGLTALDGAVMPRAAKLVIDPDRAAPNPMVGHVTSYCHSPGVGAWIALALLAGGRERHGEELYAVSPLANARVRVRVGPPCFVDPEGVRLRG